MSLLCGVLALLVPAPAFAWRDRGDAPAAAPAEYSVGYTSFAALRAAVADARATVLRRVDALQIAQVRTNRAERLAREPGVRFVERVEGRTGAEEPALDIASGKTLAWEWQYAAAREDAVPQQILRAASAVTIAVVDTGADVTAPDLAAKNAVLFNTRTGTNDVRDTLGHGTFVAALAAGSVTNGDGIAGFGGDAKLMIIKAGPGDGSFTDVDEAAAIVYAVDHGARIVNLSLGGTATTSTEQNAIAYAAAHGVLLVAAAGNDYLAGNPVIYPAALLQPLGSRGVGGNGLAVGASDESGARAPFSSTGTYISLLAPGEDVFSAVSSTSSPSLFPRVQLPGSLGGLYGYGNGTSFAAPQVAGAAALVMAANPLLDAIDVARIIKESASGHGVWTLDSGYGVLDVANAVDLATGAPASPARATLTLAARPARRQVQLTATLASLVPAVSTASRPVAFASYRNGTWKPIGTATTGAGGKATLKLAVTKAGRLTLRARWAGAGDLASAVSRSVAVTMTPRAVR